MAASRIIYLFTLLSGVKKKDFQRFLVSEWIPALINTPGCLEVEILDAYWDRAGFCVSELWESRTAHEQGARELWGSKRKDLFEKVFQYARMEMLWECTIVERFLGKEVKESERSHQKHRQEAVF